MARIVAAFWVMVFLVGCATPGPRSRYIQQIEPATLTNLAAFRYGTNLELRLPLRGRDAFAHANWPARKPGRLTTSTESPS